MREELMRIWTLNPKTIVYVTYDIEKTLLLADRVLLFTPRPGKEKMNFI
jgi:NitT/TauT family transport system ATP-binding protein